MSIEQYVTVGEDVIKVLPGEEVVKSFPGLSVGRGKGVPSKGYNGYVTTKRVTFVKQDEIHETLFSTLTSIIWEKRRRFGKWMLILGIILAIALIGIVLIALWALDKKEYLVIYGRGEEIVVSANTMTTLQDLATTMKNQRST